MTFCQVGGGTLVVEPGEGRDPLTVNDQVALKLSQGLITIYITDYITHCAYDQVALKLFQSN